AYVPIPHADLEFVQLIVRHGDRTPYVTLSHDNATWRCDTSNSPHSASLQSSPGDGPSEEHRCSPGDLTNRGKAQLRRLGAQLHEVYVDRLGFLPKALDRPEAVYFRATHVPRTQESGRNLLRGLWPEGSGKAADGVPVHVLPQELETMFDNPNICPNVYSYATQIRNSRPYTTFLKDQAEFMNRLIAIFGVSGDKWLSNWSGYVDVLWSRHCHNMALPCMWQAVNTTAACASVEDAKQAMRNAHFEWTLKYRDHLLSTQYLRCAIGAFLGTLHEQIQDHIAGKIQGLRLALYSAHDSTVAAILGAFKASNRDILWPPYAANIAIELWKNLGGNRVVRVMYNGQALLLQEGQQWCDLGACPIDIYGAHLKHYIPANITAQ
ncbi:hypothetical protein EC988_000849, partial [Linderina pennispora]